MSGKILTIVMCVLTALNVALTVVNLSTRATAQFGATRMRATDLINDFDFQRAVETIVVDDCKVDAGSIHCKHSMM
jgi:hypothetical protein